MTLAPRGSGPWAQAVPIPRWHRAPQGPPGCAGKELCPPPPLRPPQPLTCLEPRPLRDRVRGCGPSPFCHVPDPSKCCYSQETRGRNSLCVCVGTDGTSPFPWGGRRRTADPRAFALSETRRAPSTHEDIAPVASRHVADEVPVSSASNPLPLQPLPPPHGTSVSAEGKWRGGPWPEGRRRCADCRLARPTWGCPPSPSRADLLGRRVTGAGSARGRLLTRR